MSAGYNLPNPPGIGGVVALDPDPNNNNQYTQLTPVTSANHLYHVGRMAIYHSPLVNSIGFETGDFSQTAAHQGGTIVTSPALDGMFSLQLLRNNSAAWAEIGEPDDQTFYNLPTAFYSFEFQYASQTGEGGVVNFEDPSGSYKAALHLSASGKLLFYDASGNLLATGTTTLNANQTYTISATIGPGTWDVRINGVLEMSGTGNLGKPGNGAIRLGGNSPYTTDYYYDDVAISPNVVPAGGLVVNPAGQQTATEGVPATISLGSISEATPNAVLNGNPWTVTVNWGDMTPNNSFTIPNTGGQGLPIQLGSIQHIFSQEDNTVTVTVANAANVVSSGAFQVIVSDPAVSNVSAVAFASKPTVSGQVVATFTDPGGVEAIGDYSATIDWGDGTTPTTGGITEMGNTVMVSGDHTYPSTSQAYSFTVIVGHETTPSQSVTGIATISPGDPGTSTTVTSSLSTSVAGQPVTFTATVRPGGPGTPTGTVRFFDNLNTGIGTATVSTSGGVTTATLTTGILAAGTHTITAIYNGDSNFSASFGSVTQTVNTASTSTAVSSSANPAVPGQSVTFTATVSVNAPGSTAAGYPSGTVIFRDNGTSIGQGTLSTAGGITQAIFSTSTLTQGSHPITASYVGDSNFTPSVSAPLSLTVQQPVPSVQPPANQMASEGWAKSVNLGAFSEAGPGPWTATAAWGDGTSTTLPAPSGPGSLGNYSHTYAEEGTYTVTVTVTDTGANTSGSATFTVNVLEVALTTAPVSISPTFAVPFSGAVATFTDLGGAEANDGTHYSASINWGDGTAPATGSISYSGGIFTVNGTHTYAAANSYTVAVTIGHEGWMFALVQSPAAVTTFVAASLVKPTSFWEGGQGQQLIRRFGLTSSNQTLGQWLAATFPNLYGGAGGAPNLSPFTNSQVGSYYQSLYLSSQGSGLDVGILDTALDDFATTSSLGGTLGQSYGFTVNSYGLGAYSWNIATSGAAFGTPNNTVLTVNQILLAANNNASGGEPWGSNTLFRNEALTVFQGINAV
ncbi:MAG TPA: Ig-like domain-containing protein [Gemmataceae bacterium]|nr:Ig-like domain-containing protein [Gemmataceae bacterium]